METSLHTFANIFGAFFSIEGESVVLRRIVIPIIQRDYAQGREDNEIKRVRFRFLSSLHRAVTEQPITLDFVYGDIDSEGTMTPLDGQQRLTTLFLLHWYAAKKENVLEEDSSFLSNFSYETRYSARDFCAFLVEFTPCFVGKLSDEIINQSWFPLDWKKDPTISSMLVMIDAIQETFNDVDDLWEKLKSGAISFYFLPIKDMGLTDELYIKMNSRGKPLTQFEHFKAELQGVLSLVDEDISRRIIRKIDIAWTNLLWPYRGEDNVIDDEFLRYFKFICDVLCYHAGGTPQGKSNDEFDLLQEYFSPQCATAADNARTMERYIDCWCDLNGDNPSQFLSRFMSHEHEGGKIRIDTRYIIDILDDCLRNYADTTGRRRIFPLNRIVLLYAFTSYLLHKESITQNQFARRLRIVNNLIQNSEDEISDSEARTSGNRMPAILAQVDSIIISGMIDETIEKSFAVSQLSEEAEKIKWVNNNPDKAETLFYLEDHPLLQGQISIIGLENYELFTRFYDLFSCDWDLVDCALMSIGFYGQKEVNGWRFQLGSGSQRNITAWRALFHKSRNSGFEATREILTSLMSRMEIIDENHLRAIVQSFIDECEKKAEYPWRYYYVKYSEFRPMSYGKYSNSNIVRTPYLFSVMQTQTKWSENTYIPYFCVVDKEHISRDDMGQRLNYPTFYITCTNSAYEVWDRTEKSVSSKPKEVIEIRQNELGIDTEDRMKKLRDYLQTTL